MTQPAGFRTTGAGWRKREREQLNYILAVERQIAFPGIALGAIKLTLQRKPQNIAIERFTAGVGSIGRHYPGFETDIHGAKRDEDGVYRVRVLKNDERLAR